MVDGAQDQAMEPWDALRARRNVRQFTDRPVLEEALDRILEAGRRAPSASNWQPWDVVLVRDRAQLVELAKVWQQQAKTVLGFPDGRLLAYVLSVGYPADRPMAAINRLNRRPFDEVVHHGRW
jgi:nitroreductase